MTFESVFFRLLVLGLLIVTVDQFIRMGQQIGFAIRNPEYPLYTDLQWAMSALGSIGRFLLALTALYFVPRLVRKLLLEKV